MREHKQVFWTSEELDILSNSYGKIPMGELAALLHRTESQIRNAAFRYEINSPRTWKEEDDEYLRANAGKTRYADIAKTLHRTEQAVSIRCAKLGLQNGKNSWSKKDLEILIDGVNSTSYEDLSVQLGRSVKAIYTKVSELGIQHAAGYKILKLQQQEFIVNNYNKFTDAQFAEMFGCSESSIVAVRRKHDIRKTRLVHNSTQIEDKIAALLDELSISYERHVKWHSYELDFLLNDNVVIEVLSDYFHCNPYLHPEGPKNEDQVHYVVNDYYKKCWLFSRGYKVLYIWEKDILSSFDDVKSQIVSFCRPASISVEETG